MLQFCPNYFRTVHKRLEMVWFKKLRIFTKIMLAFIALNLVGCDSIQNTPVTTTLPLATTATVTTLANSPVLAFTPATTDVSLIEPTPTLTGGQPSLSPFTITVPPKPTSPQDWQYRWLKGIPCRPPCFEGVTPGSTTSAEAIKLLEQNPLVAHTKIYSPTMGSNIGSIAWDWIDGTRLDTGQIGAGGQLSYDTKTSAQTISYIRATLPAYTLAEVIKAYGEPSHIVAALSINPEKSSFYYHVSITYLSQGLVLSTRFSGLPVLNSNLRLENTQFFVPGVDGFSVSYPIVANKKFLVSWQGFKDFRFYCREPGGDNCDKLLKP